MAVKKTKPKLTSKVLNVQKSKSAKTQKTKPSLSKKVKVKIDEKLPKKKNKDKRKRMRKSKRDYGSLISVDTPDMSHQTSSNKEEPETPKKPKIDKNKKILDGNFKGIFMFRGGFNDGFVLAGKTQTKPIAITISGDNLTGKLQDKNQYIVKIGDADSKIPGKPLSVVPECSAGKEESKTKYVDKKTICPPKPVWKGSTYDEKDFEKPPGK